VSETNYIEADCFLSFSFFVRAEKSTCEKALKANLLPGAVTPIKEGSMSSLSNLPPSTLPPSTLPYQEFMAELDEIQRLKWISSEDVGRDIGFEQALNYWAQNHRAEWRRGRNRVVEELKKQAG
jgi:hypothetical protein